MFKQGIIDISFIAYRSMFSLTECCINFGDSFQNTTIIHGCLFQISKIMKRYNPEKWFLSYDMKPTKRLEIDSTYKKHRALFHAERKKAINFYWQLQQLKKILSYSKFIQCYKEGYESDDIIATLAKEKESIIIANDKDLYQLLDTVVIDNLKEIKNKTWFISEYGITPNKWIEVQAIVGDNADGIKGKRGYGIKKALKAVKEGKTEGLISEKDLELVKLHTDLDITYIYPTPNYDILFNYFLAFQLYDLLTEVKNFI